ncbi:Actin filament-coating protein tropomyosin [Forsythia ovata]|uniref:Actin filament-coating protein tropomyosin n=1 Tax=Forsythia ovata TaxID=205694 RepID=A0ABD1RZ97_9LAMI
MIPVAANDVAFSIHAVLLTALTLFQIANDVAFSIHDVLLTALTLFQIANDPISRRTSIVVTSNHSPGHSRSVSGRTLRINGSRTSRRGGHNEKVERARASEEGDIKSDAFRKAYLQCSNTIQNMEKELRSACHAPGEKVDSVFKVIDCFKKLLLL